MKVKVAIVGTGELALHISHYLNLSDKYRVVGYIDDFVSKGILVNSLPVICSSEEAFYFYNSENVFDEIVVAIGYSRMNYRAKVFNNFFGKIKLTTFIHNSCVVDETVELGEGVIVFPGCVIDRNVSIKNNVFLHVGCIISHDSTICDNSYLSPNTTTAGFVEIGEGCNIGISTTISNHAKIHKGVRTGAGTVVVRDIIEPGTYVGVPARKIKNTI